MVPHPFGKGVFIAGEPITVDRSSNADILEEKRLELEEALNKLTEEADNYFNNKD